MYHSLHGGRAHADGGRHHPRHRARAGSRAPSALDRDLAARSSNRARAVPGHAAARHRQGRSGDQQKDGAEPARAACERLGLPKDEVELVAWLVEQPPGDERHRPEARHLRSADDRRIRRDRRNLERLRLLLVLTVADIRAVGPGVWNGWKGQLLRDLYYATEAVFRGGRGSDPAAQRAPPSGDDAADDARAALTRIDPGAEGLGRRHGGRLLHRLRRGAELPGARRCWPRRAARRRRRGRGPHPPDRNAAEVVIAAPDRPRLFADLAAALSGRGRQRGRRPGLHLARAARRSTCSTSRTSRARRLARQPARARPAGRGPGGRRPGRARGARARRKRRDLGRAPPSSSPQRDASTTTPRRLRPWSRSPAATGRACCALSPGPAGRRRPVDPSAHIDGYGERARRRLLCATDAGGKLTDAERQCPQKR